MTGIALKYQPKSEFHRELRDRVERYFTDSGLARRGLWSMYLKTATVLAWLAVSYVLLVFFATAWWHAIPLGLSLAVAMAGVGFNVPHDAAHGGYSDRKPVNRLAGLAFDLVGGSSYFWYWQHNVLHHNYTNLDGFDHDISVGPFARLSPAQPRYRPHRYQHLYMWGLYGFVAIKWHLLDDFVALATGRMGDHTIPRPTGSDAFLFFLGKAAFLSLALVVPALVHPVWLVVLSYLSIGFVTGVIVGVVFQLAHCLEEAEFPPLPEGNRIPSDWATHQVETTVDFAPGNAFLTWYLGGLNYQVEHHLFPNVCHLHYPALSRIVVGACEEYDVKYRAHRTFRDAIGSHYRWLRQLGAA